MSSADGAEYPGGVASNGAGPYGGGAFGAGASAEAALVAEELTGGTEFGDGGDEAAVLGGDAHQIVRNDGSEAALSLEPAPEAAATAYEEVEGFVAAEYAKGAEADESLEEAEPTVEAYFGSIAAQETRGDEEFFAALAAIAAPALKAIVPAIIGAAAKRGASRLSQRAAARIRALRSRTRRPGAQREAAFDESGVEAGLDHMTEAEMEAALESLEQLEVVIGRDDRVRVTATTQVPWRRICHLAIRARDNRMFVGTGFFIGNRTVMTAGHCVFLNAHGGWAKEILVTPGRNGDQRPYPGVRATTFRSVRGWTVGRDRNYDYGAIILPPGPRTNIGAFGFGALPDSNLLQARVNLSGYPGDKLAGTQWYHGLKTKSVAPRVVTYDIDTAGGQSGSPVWINRNGVRTVVGIHTNGSSRGNSATRIVRPVYDNMLAWREEGR